MEFNEENQKSAQGKKREFPYVGGVHTSERSGTKF
jgi:hypothetical protein